jgi:medium-chain acyl-[acyl-carrier-protein] hydrolase
MTFPSLLSVVIKWSGDQSALLNRDNAFVAQFGLTWVITNYEIDITKMPRVEQTVMITTEAMSYNKFFCYRNFWIHDEVGNQLMEIRATFVLMDRVNRKMGHVIEEIIAPYQSEKIKKILRAPLIEAINEEEKVSYRVRFSDIDSNQHVNNAKYYDWILDVLGFDFLTTYVATYVNMRFIKEVEYGAVVESVFERSQKDGEILTKHRIDVDGVPHAEANILWRPMVKESREKREI